MANLRLKKLVGAHRSYGRGIDNTSTPAVWAVLSGGVEIGIIRAESVQMFQPQSWEFCPNRDVCNLVNVPPKSTKKALMESIRERIVVQGH